MTFQIDQLTVHGVAVLAPMAGMTDLSFRRLCAAEGCSLVYTELVHARLLLQGAHRSLQNVEVGADERPVGVQLYGHDPAVLADAAAWVEENIECDLIDLNMGCPVPKIVSRGAGAAIMRDPALVERLVRAVSDAVSLPVTAKTRSGWDDAELNALPVGKAVEQGGGKALAVHARTRAQRHEGPVNWELLAQIKAELSIPVIGNGGVTTPEGALAMREATGIDAVMVGRGALGNPWLFGQIDDLWHGRPVTLPTPAQRRAMLVRHLAVAKDGFERWATRNTTRRGKTAEGRAMAFLRGHLIRYMEGAPGRDGFRARLNELLTVEAVLEAADDAWGWDDAVRAETESLLAAA
ncbi:MAG: tRNA dihydrouridine synthase DusB [Deltaproteobacteria bacterium]|nr:tRNA dihydrouridine synthase DusB [Deltaproteobacteria bacterium]